jgi:hypothetical protein
MALRTYVAQANQTSHVTRTRNQLRIVILIFLAEHTTQ